jgi:hypothetical protein
MAILNFGDAAGDISLPFPQAGTYREMMDDDVRSTQSDLKVASDGAFQTVTVPSHYWFVFLKIA